MPGFVPVCPAQHLIDDPGVVVPVRGRVDGVPAPPGRVIRGFEWPCVRGIVRPGVATTEVIGASGVTVTGVEQITIGSPTAPLVGQPCIVIAGAVVVIPHMIVILFVRMRVLAVAAGALVKIIRPTPGVELVGGLFHALDVALLLVDRSPMVLGVCAELVGFRRLGTRLLLRRTRSVLVLTGHGVLSLELLLAFTCAPPQFSGLGELLAVTVPDCQGDERDDHYQRDHPDHDPNHGVHSCLLLPRSSVPGT